ncbi:hypothetical protein [Methanoculleus sp.]|uniref:hypothetical protein n=1 Tax=Methanoculleus sp. TaxID=90427 RepID=UPI002FC8E674
MTGITHPEKGVIIQACSGRTVIALAIALTAVIFLTYCGFSMALPENFPLDLSYIIAIASQSGAIGFQLISIRYLFCRVERVSLEGIPEKFCYPGGDWLPHAVRRVLHDSTIFTRFIALFLLLFIVIESVSFLGEISAVMYLLERTPLGIPYYIFNYGVTFTNYFLLGTILWVLVGTVLAIGEIKRVRSTISSSIEVYCPDQIGGLSPVKEYLFRPLYVFLVSVTLLMLSYFNLLPFFTAFFEPDIVAFASLDFSAFSGSISNVFIDFFGVILCFSLFSLLALVGVIVTIVGLNRLSSLYLNDLEERIATITAKYNDSLAVLLSMSPDEIRSSEKEVNNLNLALTTFSTEREKLLQWHSRCSRADAWTVLRLLVVAYVPPVVTVVFQVSQLLAS